MTFTDGLREEFSVIARHKVSAHAPDSDDVSMSDVDVVDGGCV